jgi:sugar lactone lactonase YvrE
MSIRNAHAIEAELEVARGAEADLEFEIGKLEAELGLETLRNGRVEVSFEAGGDEFEFVFRPREGVERSFEIEVKCREYLVELEAGRGDEPGLIAAEVEITPKAWQKPPHEAELELAVGKGDSGDGALEFKGVEVGLEAEAVGKKYLVEVELENEKTGKSVERKFWVDPDKAFEKEFKLALGGKVFELELETESDPKENEFSASLEVELARPDADTLFVSSTNTNSVMAYDGETGAFLGKFARGGGLIEPEGIAFGPDGNLYVASRSDEVLRYDGEKGKFIDVFASGHGLVDPAGIAFGGPGNDLFVGAGLTDDGLGNQILRFDGATGAFEAVVDPVNAAGLDDPEAVVFGPDGLLYVASTPESGPGEVLRYNPATNSFVDKFVPSSESNILDPTGMVFGPDGDLFLSSAATSEVMRYDGTTGNLEGVFITAGSGGLNEAEGMAFGPNGNLLVASELGHSVLEYDGSTGAFVREFVAAGSGGLSEPTFIIFGLPQTDDLLV